jgi:hypothetical protein
MIEKIPGCPKINKLRVIHLYEADYNIILKIIWARKLVWHVHDNDRIHEGQAGSTIMTEYMKVKQDLDQVLIRSMA